jgi:phosphoribosyl-AMP cyclohydrolase
MNQEALCRTLESGKVWFWSRSRQVFWLKGETSGNYFTVREIYIDCDADAILVKAEIPAGGVACHTGRYSCFFNNLPQIKLQGGGGAA